MCDWNSERARTAMDPAYNSNIGWIKQEKVKIKARQKAKVKKQKHMMPHQK